MEKRTVRGTAAISTPLKIARRDSFGPALTSPPGPSFSGTRRSSFSPVSPGIRGSLLKYSAGPPVRKHADLDAGTPHVARYKLLTTYCINCNMFSPRCQSLGPVRTSTPTQRHLYSNTDARRFRKASKPSFAGASSSSADWPASSASSNRWLPSRRIAALDCHLSPYSRWS